MNILKQPTKRLNTGFANILVISLMILALGAMVFATVNVYKNVTQDQKEITINNSDDDSKSALDNYRKSSAEPLTTQVIYNTNAPSDSVSNNNLKPTESLVGNTDSTKIPVLAPAVNIPVSSIESIRAFFMAVKSSDFVTANALMGPGLASTIKNLTGTVDASKVLSDCKKDTTCNLVLNSFEPPSSNYKITPFTPQNGNKGEQVSFLLSQSAPNVVSAIATDANLDIFMENYQGVWVIQNIFANGESLNEFIDGF